MEITTSPIPGPSAKLPGLSPVPSPAKLALPMPPEHTSPSLPDPILAKQEERERRRKEKEARKKKKEEKAARRMLRKAMLKKRASLLPVAEEISSSPLPRVSITENTTGMTLPVAERGILLSASSNAGEGKRKAVSFADGIRPGEGTSPSGGEDHPLSPPPKPRKTKRKKKKKKRKVKVRIIRLGRGGEEEDEAEGEKMPPPPPPSEPPPISYLDISNLPIGYGYVEFRVFCSSEHRRGPDGTTALLNGTPSTSAPTYSGPAVIRPTSTLTSSCTSLYIIRR
uniref:Uncharacterized protein n=2 Tax=Lygus hesperus TaxID=30085 RepID=A0A0A9W8V6_LYGHE